MTGCEKHTSGVKTLSRCAAVLPEMNPRPTASGMAERVGNHEPFPAKIKVNEGQRCGILVSHPTQTGVPGARTLCDGVENTRRMGHPGFVFRSRVGHPAMLRHLSSVRLHSS